MVLTFESVDKILNFDQIQINAIEQYFPVVLFIMPYCLISDFWM